MALASQGHVSEVIVFSEGSEGLGVLLLIVIPPEEGILNIFLGF